MRIIEDKRKINSEIRKSNKVFLMAHKDLDLDALGSCIGMYLFLKRKKKDCYIVIDDQNHELGVEKVLIELEGCIDIIKSDLKKNEYQWKNLEMEETQLKVESTEIILDQLYNEVIEILEHIQYNRISPELYQNKSIYACEEIPKLSFQQTTTEDVGMPEGEENDMLNI